MALGGDARQLRSYVTVGVDIFIFIIFALTNLPAAAAAVRHSSRRATLPQSAQGQAGRCQKTQNVVSQP